jgi:hypothetical protein
MSSKLHSLSDAEFEKVRDSRASVANMLGPVAVLVCGVILFGPPMIQELAVSAAAVLFVLFGGVYWFWLRPLFIEERRRSDSKSM